MPSINKRIYSNGPLPLSSTVRGVQGVQGGSSSSNSILMKKKRKTSLNNMAGTFVVTISCCSLLFVVPWLLSINNAQTNFSYVVSFSSSSSSHVITPSYTNMVENERSGENNTTNIKYSRPSSSKIAVVDSQSQNKIRDSEYPNVTAMMRNYDIKLQKDPNSKKFQSKILGILCGSHDSDNDVDNGNDVTKKKMMDELRGEEKCRKIRLPLRAKGGKVVVRGEDEDKDDCWPRLAVIASYPTSGNFLARMLFSLNTGLATGVPYEGNNTLTTMFDWSGKARVGNRRRGHFPPRSREGGGGGSNGSGQKKNLNVFNLHAKSHCDSNLQLPYAGRVALVKTHGSPDKHGIDIENDIAKGTMNNNHNQRQERPSHIIHLVRNPGDHLVRNKSRWITSRNDKNDNSTQFEESAKTFCQKILQKEKVLSKFINFHKQWLEVSKETDDVGSNGGIPTILLHYEEMINLDLVDDKMRQVVEFVGEKKRFDVDYDKVLKAPSYEQGTLFRDICGVEMARELHEKTKELDDLFGYSFDSKTGAWNLNLNVTTTTTTHVT